MNCPADGSSGWRLAACLIHQPKLLLLDEPTAGVDPKARRDFWEHIHDLAAQGLTFLITTHYMDEAERCHRLAYIAYGKLLAHGTVPEVIAARRFDDLVGRRTAICFSSRSSSAVARASDRPWPSAACCMSAATMPQALERAIAPFRASPYEWTGSAPASKMCSST